MPTFRYAASGALPERSRTRAGREAFDRLADSLLEQGGLVLRQLRHDPVAAALLVEAGYLELDEGAYRVAARGVRRAEESALRELFAPARGSEAGQHEGSFRGEGTERREDSRAFVPGDGAEHLNLSATLKNALLRQGPRLPLALARADLVVHETEARSRQATVLLLDQSGSMARHGKFGYAKRLALALRALVRTRYPEDHLAIVGFATRPVVLSWRELLEAVPRPVGLVDRRGALRVPARTAPEDVPQHFTNIQAGLRLARRLLQRHGARNKRVLLITDGEPTAHLEGTELVLSYPATEQSARKALEEGRRCVEEGASLSLFALLDEPDALGLRAFVDRLARAGRGALACCTARELGRQVVESFVRLRSPRG